MKVYSVLVFVVLVELFVCGTKFSDREFEAIEHVGKHLNSRFFVFVDDGKSFDLTMKIRRIYKKEFYSSVLTTTILEKILQKNVTQLNFFQRKTVIVTKEELKLTNLLDQILMPHLLTWLIFRDYSRHDKSLYVPLSSDVLFVSSTSDVITIRQVYHLKPGHTGVSKTIWHWEFSHREKPPLDIDYQKKDFLNVTMDVHYLFLKECNDIRGKLMRVKIECLQQKIMELIATRLNFSTNYIECIEKENAYVFPNGSDSELFIKLKKKEVDFSIASHVVRKKRHGSLDYIWPTFVLNSRMYLKQGKFKGHLTSYLRPLDPSVWGGILALIFVSGFLTKIFEKILLGKFKFNLFLIFDLIQSTFKSLQVFCSQAVTDIPTSTSIRILYLLKLFVFVIFFQAYCGYLVSSLTIAVPYFPFMDLNGFFENKQYQLMTIRKGFQRYFYRKVIGEGQRDDFMLPDDDLPEDAPAAINKLCEENHLAFVDFRESILDLDKFACKVAELPSHIAVLYMGVASPRNSPYKEFVSRELLYFGSTGIRKRITSHLSSKLYFRNKKEREEYVTVSMAEIFSVFILLSFGMFISLIIFLVEVLLAEGVKSHIKRVIFQKNKVVKKRQRKEVSLNLINVKSKTVMKK